MISYPVTNPAWACPVTRSLEFQTHIAVGDNDTEQRTMWTTGIESWSFTYSSLSLTQRNTLLTTFESAKGAYDQTIRLVFGGATFDGLYFDGDELSFTEQSQGVWSGSVKLSTSVRAADSGTMATDFPHLSSGAAMQFPFTHGKQFNTVAVRTDGARFSYARRSASLRAWSAGGTAINNTEAQAIWDMFRFAAGRWRSFAFTDPDSGTRYTNCRFGSDKVDWRIIGPGQNSIQVTIQQCP